MVSLLFGQDEAVAQWVFARNGGSIDAPFTAIGVVRDGAIVGGVVYERFQGQKASIEMHCAGERGWLTKDRIKVFFMYPFGQLKCRTVVALSRRKNKAARKLIEGLGWRRPYRVPHYFPDDDLVIYSMTAKECRWLKEGKSNG